MQIKYLDLQAQYHSIQPEIDGAVAAVLESSAFTLGPAVKQFEDSYADYCGTDFCAGVNNGTNALLLALRALDVGPGDEVVTCGQHFHCHGGGYYPRGSPSGAGRC